MKTQNTNKKLGFSKNSIVELQNSELLKINGGVPTTGGGDQTTIVCGDCILVPTVIRDLSK